MRKPLLAGACAALLFSAFPRGAAAQNANMGALAVPSCGTQNLAPGYGRPVTQTTTGLLCTNSSSGGGAVYGPTQAGSAASYPPILVAGTSDGTSTGEIYNWLVDSGGIGHVYDGAVNSTLSSILGAVQSPNLCAVTTSPPSYASGTTNNQSCDVYGNMRVILGASSNLVGSFKLADSAGTNLATVKASSTPASTTDTSVVTAQSPTISMACPNLLSISQSANTEIIVGTSGKTIYFCDIVIINSASGAPQSIGLAEGTNSTCTAGASSVIGVPTPSSAVGTLGLAAGGGFAAVSDRPHIQTHAAGDNICLDQSGTGNLSGYVTYAAQ